MSRESIVTWADGTTGKVTFSEYGSSSNAVPMNPTMQRIAAQVRAQKEAETSTPENRQKATEAEIAERAQKKHDFHFIRAVPQHVEEGWKHIQGESADEEIRVYTIDNERRRFWGIKPAGIGMHDFWEQNDPEVRRYDDRYAITWANPLFRPPFNSWEEDTSMEWAGQGPNPDATPSEPPVAEETPTLTKAAKPRRRQKTPELNPTNKVKKSKAPSRKTNKKSTRKSLAGETDAGPSRLEDQIPEEPIAAPATGGPSQNAKILPLPTLQREPAPKDQDQLPTPSKHPRRHAARTADPVPATSALPAPKRPRGRPPKAHTTTKNKHDSTPKRPRGRPPGKGKSTAAVQGNARVTKSSTSEKQNGRRALAPSTHVMRTRGKGAAESLQLP